MGGFTRFLENEAEKKIPFMKLLRKDTLWKWENEQEEVFQNLKRALMEAPVLVRPVFSKTFSIPADSSQYAVGAVLTQEHENEEHPIVHVSIVLTLVESNYSTTDHEMLAIMFAIRKFRCYIEGYHFKIIIFIIRYTSL